MHTRTSSSGSSSSSTADVLDYGDITAAPKTTLQKRDYRPKSTFWKKPLKDMNYGQFICWLAATPDAIHELKPLTFDRGPIQEHPLLSEQFFIVSSISVPFVLQLICHNFFDYQWSASVAYPIFLLSFVFFAFRVLHRMNALTLRYGTFGEKSKSRDRIPDNATTQLAAGVSAYLILRLGMAFYFYYDPTETIGITWKFPVRLVTWQLVFDYTFYSYHRLTHEVDSLWFIHKHHHSTTRPSVILAILADGYQECLEIILIPLFATIIVPMTFAELYAALAITVFVEMMGHTGLRNYYPHPSLFFLRVFGCELTVEDHDLHHQNGKKGANFGKQSRLFDMLFNTMGERVETAGK